jgi:transposase-like protein
VSHANAALTPRGCLRLARLVIDEGWPVARAAERYEVSWPTVNRWAERYRAEGVAEAAEPLGGVPPRRRDIGSELDGLVGADRHDAQDRRHA